jgi:hypothetical protein
MGKVVWRVKRRYNDTETGETTQRRGTTNLHVRLYLRALEGNRGRAPTRSLRLWTVSKLLVKLNPAIVMKPGARPHCGLRRGPVSP